MPEVAGLFSDLVRWHLRYTGKESTKTLCRPTEFYSIYLSDSVDS